MTKTVIRYVLYVGTRSKRVLTRICILNLLDLLEDTQQQLAKVQLDADIHKAAEDHDKRYKQRVRHIRQKRTQS